jgi:hypothetical protein
MKGIQITAVGALEDVIAVTDLPEPKEPDPVKSWSGWSTPR